MLNALYGFFADQHARIVKALEKGRDALLSSQAQRQELTASKAWSLDMAVDWNAEEQALSASIIGLLKRVIGDAIEETQGQYERMGVRTSWEVWDKAAVELAQKYQYDLIKDINDSTRQQLGKAIGQWIEAGDEFPKLVDQVRKIIPPTPQGQLRDRAKLIAATEVTRVYSDSRAAGMTAVGLTKAVWKTAADEMVCPICAPLNGTEGTILGGFVHPTSGVVVPRPPAHPGCRCWQTESTDEMSALAAQAPQPIEPEPEDPFASATLLDFMTGSQPVSAGIPWSPMMDADMASQWVGGTTYENDTFYHVIPQGDAAGMMQTGILPKKMSDTFGDAILVYSQNAMPPQSSLADKEVLQTKITVKNPFVIQNISELKNWELANGKGSSLGKTVNLLQQHGYDAVVHKAPNGNTLGVYVLEPANVTMLSEDGKPLTYSKIKPKKPKAQPLAPAPAPATPAPQVAPIPASVPPVIPPIPPAASTAPASVAPVTPPASPLAQWDLDHDMLLARDLHAKDGPWGATGKARPAYGAVIFDDQDRVLLRKPSGEFGGYVWTWPKGGAESGDHPLTAALREVEEETGHSGHVVGVLPGKFKSSGSGSTYFALMRSTGVDSTKMDTETEEVRWVTRDEAIELIKQTKLKGGKERDLAVLEAAFGEHEKLKDPTYRAQVRQALEALPPAKVKPKIAPVSVTPTQFPYALSEMKDTGEGNSMGGAHPKTVYVAPDGDRWMFKPQEEWRAQVDRTTYEVAHALGIDAAETHVVTVNGKVGSIQRLYKGAKAFDSIDASELTTDQLVAAQRENIFDWLIGNHDGHAGNVMRLPDGSIIGIDKGQAFKFFETDSLDWNWNPNPTQGTWYNLRLKKWANGESVFWAAPDHPEIKGMIERIQNLDDDEYRRILRPYAEKAIKVKFGGGKTPVPHNDVDKFLDAAVQRKNTIGKAFQDQYDKALAQRNKALGITAAPPVLTPINTQFVDEVLKSGWQGKAMLFGGQDVEDMHALVYKVDGDGTLLDMKLRKGAQDKIMASLGIQNISAPQSSSSSAPNDPYWQDILKVAKSYNFHLQPGSKGYDGQIPSHTASSIDGLYANLKGSTDPAAAHHLPYIEKLWQEIHGTLPTASNLHMKASEYIAPPSAPSKPASAPSRTRRNVQTQQGPSEMLHVRNRDGRVELIGGNVSRNGRGIRIDFEPGMTAQYTPHDNTNDAIYSHQGHFQIQIDGDPTPDKLKAVVGHLADLGLDTTEATATDAEFLYLTKVGYASGNLDKMGLKESMTIAEKTEKMVKWWNKSLGTDVRSLPGYKPTPSYESPAPILGNVKGNFGMPRWKRFDVTEEDLEREMPGYMLQHGLNSLYGRGPSLEKLDVILSANGDLISTEEKFRLGIPLSSTSPVRDQETGGAAYAFTRIVAPGSIPSSPYNLFFDKSLLLDPDAISYSHDIFGEVFPTTITRERKRSFGDLRNAAMNGGNETIIKRGVSLWDHLRGVRVETAAEKKKVIALLKKYGFTNLGGKSLDEAVWVHKT